MNLSQLLPAPMLASPTTNANLIAVEMSSDAVPYLREQAWADLHYGLFSPQLTPFTVSELIEILALLPGQVENSVMTPRQSMRLFSYVTHYYKKAIWKGDDAMAGLYSEFMDDLMPGTLITFQL